MRKRELSAYYVVMRKAGWLLDQKTNGHVSSQGFGSFVLRLVLFLDTHFL